MKMTTASLLLLILVSSGHSLVLQPPLEIMELADQGGDTDPWSDWNPERLRETPVVQGEEGLRETPVVQGETPVVQGETPVVQGEEGLRETPVVQGEEGQQDEELRETPVVQGEEGQQDEKLTEERRDEEALTPETFYPGQTEAEDTRKEGEQKESEDALTPERPIREEERKRMEEEKTGEGLSPESDPEKRRREEMRKGGETVDNKEGMLRAEGEERGDRGVGQGVEEAEKQLVAGLLYKKEEDSTVRVVEELPVDNLEEKREAAYLIVTHLDPPPPFSTTPLSLEDDTTHSVANPSPVSHDDVTPPPSVMSSQAVISSFVQGTPDSLTLPIPDSTSQALDLPVNHTQDPSQEKEKTISLVDIDVIEVENVTVNSQTRHRAQEEFVSKTMEVKVGPTDKVSIENKRAEKNKAKTKVFKLTTKEPKATPKPKLTNSTAKELKPTPKSKTMKTPFTAKETKTTTQKLKKDPKLTHKPAVMNSTARTLELASKPKVSKSISKTKPVKPTPKASKAKPTAEKLLPQATPKPGKPKPTVKLNKPQATPKPGKPKPTIIKLIKPQVTPKAGKPTPKSIKNQVKPKPETKPTPKSIKLQVKPKPLLPKTTSKPLMPKTTSQPLVPNTTPKPLLSKTTHKPLLSKTTHKPLLSKTTSRPLLPKATSKPLLSKTTHKPLLPNTTSRPLLPEPTSKVSETMSIAKPQGTQTNHKIQLTQPTPKTASPKLTPNTKQTAQSDRKKKTQKEKKDKKKHKKGKALNKNNKIKKTKQELKKKDVAAPTEFPYFQDYYCPTECACYGGVVQCSDKGVDKVPYGIPYGARYILLMNNHIDSIQLDLLNEYLSMEFLVLTNNRLTDGSIEGALEGIPALKRLYLDRNLLDSVPTDLPASLEELRLDANKLSVMSEPAWERCPGLLILSLSNNSLGNGSDTLPTGVLSPLVNLRTLSLDHNRLASVPLGLPLSIKELYLRGNVIQNFTGKVFIGRSELLVLDLSANQLTDKGFHKDSLLNATHLESLNLEGNRLKQIPRHLPPTIKTLNLEGNLISSINKSAFLTLLNLEHLGLAKNRISRVAAGAFRTLPVLHQLDMSHNALRHVPRQLPRGLHSAALTHNKISSVPRDAFCWGGSTPRLSSLVRVQLEHNLIDLGTLDTQAFSCLRGFQVVHFY